MEYPNSIESYLASKPEWRESLLLLRDIFGSTELTETIKWGMPVYTLNNKNVAGFCAFRSYVGIWFYQGVFLKDPFNKLVNAQEGITKAMRQWRFSSAKDIINEKNLILKYVEEAIHNQKEGNELIPDRRKSLIIPEVLQKALSENEDLRLSFESFSAAKKREFAEYIKEAKRPDTKERRLGKIIPMILDGTGLNDRYK
jgi:uncharacterized protein YdeI (YjbR/CyaY-like superfamily)